MVIGRRRLSPDDGSATSNGLHSNEVFERLVLDIAG